MTYSEKDWLEFRSGVCETIRKVGYATLEVMLTRDSEVLRPVRVWTPKAWRRAVYYHLLPNEPNGEGDLRLAIPRRGDPIAVFLGDQIHCGVEQLSGGNERMEEALLHKIGDEAARENCRCFAEEQVRLKAEAEEKAARERKEAEKRAEAERPFWEAVESDQFEDARALLLELGRDFYARIPPEIKERLYARNLERLEKEVAEETAGDPDSPRGVMLQDELRKTRERRWPFVM